MEFVMEFLLKFGFLAGFAVLTFGLGVAFPKPMKSPTLERLTHLNPLLVSLAVFGGLVVGILGLLLMFITLGPWMKYYYVLVVTVYFYRFIKITADITRSVPQRIEVVATLLGARVKRHYFFAVALHFIQFIRITRITCWVSRKIEIVVTVTLALLSGSLKAVWSNWATDDITTLVSRVTEITLALSRRSEAVTTLILALTFGSFWAVWPNWATYDITALVCGYVLISAAAPKRLGLLLATFVAVLTYDVWGVLGSPAVAGGAIVQVVGQAKEYFLPVGVILTPWGGMLGLGDIVVPGLVVMMARQYGLVRESIVGWGIGLLILFFMLAAARMPLPATIVLVPTTLFAFLFAASRRQIQLQWS